MLLVWLHLDYHLSNLYQSLSKSLSLNPESDGKVEFIYSLTSKITFNVLTLNLLIGRSSLFGLKRRDKFIGKL